MRPEEKTNPGKSITSSLKIEDVTKDERGKYILDSMEKIIFMIGYFNEERRSQPYPFYNKEHLILKNCIVKAEDSHGGRLGFNLWHLADQIGLIRKCMDLTDRKYHQEVLSPILFRDCVFEQAYFGDTLFHEEVHFLNCELTILMGNSVFKNKLVIEDCQMDGLNFGFTIYHGEVLLRNIRILSGEVNFQNCNYFNKVEIDNLILPFPSTNPNVFQNRNIFFNASFFESHVLIHNIDFKDYTCYFHGCEFKKTTTFKNLKSQKEISFHGCIFETVHIGFHDNPFPIIKISLAMATITREGTIALCNLSSLDLSDLRINRDASFWIHRCRIKKIVGRRLINSGLVTFTENEKQIEKIDLANAISTGLINLENTQIRDISNRKTACLLKDSAYKSNNIIDALHYRSIEMKLHKKENGTSCATKFLLLCNWLSNNHGLSWIKGIRFTVISAIFFLWMINYGGTTQPIFHLNTRFDCTGFGEVWKSYLDVLNVLNFRERLNGIELNAWGETLFLLSKIVISYGIFQTVSAFRKYGK